MCDLERHNIIQIEWYFSFSINAGNIAADDDDSPKNFAFLGFNIHDLVAHASLGKFNQLRSETVWKRCRRIHICRTI